jgi:hypothetical protein
VHGKYFSHLAFYLQKPTAVIVRVFSYHLQIFFIFLLDKEAINCSELSALFAGLQHVTYQNKYAHTHGQRI